MKKIIVVLFLMFLWQNVYAASDMFYYDDERVEEMWITRSNGVQTRSAHPYKLKKKGSDTYVFCIEPFSLIKSGVAYSRQADLTKYGLTQKQVDRINLILYYGYGYGNHTSDLWYGLTQYLVWKEADPNATIYFTEKYKGPKKDLYTKEINEIESLIEKHLAQAKFEDEYVMESGKDFTIDGQIDLNDYDIEADIAYEIKDNKIVINSDKIGTYTFKLTNKKRTFKTEYIMFYSANSQNVIAPGNSYIYDKSYTFKVTILNGKVKLRKFSSSDNKLLKGAKYGIYQDGKLVDTIVTNDQGYGETELAFGEYVIKELVPPSGYKLDNQEYPFKIDEEKAEIEIKLYDDQAVIEVPNTGVKDYVKESIILIFLGVGLYYGQKKYYVH